MICKTFNIGELKKYKYVVILSRYNGKILLSRHKERTTWETQGGHIENGETPLEAAKRELYEESGAIQYKITSFCDYWAGDPDMVHGAGGVVFTADIVKLGNIPESEMQEVKTFDELPDNLTYPAITPVLFDELQIRNKAFDGGNHFKLEKDCCFEKNGHWFRYRAAAIIIENDCVLMARNGIDDYYYSIGGGVHLGETSEQAVVREVKEETGIDYEIDRMAFVNESMFYGDGTLSGKDCHVVEFYYLMKSKGKQLVKNAESYGTVFGGLPEHLHWIPIKEFGSKKAFPEFFKDKLLNIPENVQHIISDERR